MCMRMYMLVYMYMYEHVPAKYGVVSLECKLKSIK